MKRIDDCRRTLNSNQHFLRCQMAAHVPAQSAVLKLPLATPACPAFPDKLEDTLLCSLEGTRERRKQRSKKRPPPLYCPQPSTYPQKLFGGENPAQNDEQGDINIQSTIRSLATQSFQPQTLGRRGDTTYQRMKSPWDSDYRTRQDFDDLRSERSTSAPPPETSFLFGRNDGIVAPTVRVGVVS